VNFRPQFTLFDMGRVPYMYFRLLLLVFQGAVLNDYIRAFVGSSDLKFGDAGNPLVRQTARHFMQTRSCLKSPYRKSADRIYSKTGILTH
jgi:hypothetical protein